MGLLRPGPGFYKGWQGYIRVSAISNRAPIFFRVLGKGFGFPTDIFQGNGGLIRVWQSMLDEKPGLAMFRPSYIPICGFWPLEFKRTVV